MYKLEARQLVTPATDQEPGMKVKPLFLIISFLYFESSTMFLPFSALTKSKRLFTRGVIAFLVEKKVNLQVHRTFFRSEIKGIKFMFRIKWAISISDVKKSCVPENLFSFSAAPVDLIEVCLPTHSHAWFTWNAKLKSYSCKYIWTKEIHLSQMCSLLIYSHALGFWGRGAGTCIWEGPAEFQKQISM